MNEFQERLQELLDSLNLNRSQLAQIIGITSTTLNGYFNNGYYPQFDIAIKMAEHFDCSLNYLFGLSDEKENTNKNENSFFENFDNLIKSNKMSIAKVMQDLKMSEYNYYRWKAGKFPKTINLIEISKYFDVSIDYLVGRSNVK